MVYGLAGLPVGWLACHDRSVLDKMGKLKQYLSICNAAPSECLAVIALKARAHILALNRQLVTRVLRTPRESLVDMQIFSNGTSLRVPASPIRGIWEAMAWSRPVQAGV